MNIFTLRKSKHLGNLEANAREFINKNTRCYRKSLMNTLKMKKNS